MKQTIYHSGKEKTGEQADFYVQTHELPHRYLAYRDIPSLVDKFVKGKKALDYGAGTGASSAFLYNLGFDVIGTDISFQMLEKAKTNFPYINFHELDSLNLTSNFNLVFSSFVLFEISNKKQIVDYLIKGSSFLREDGVIIAITGSEHLYSLSRHWLTFDAKFPENIKLQSGDMAKLLLKHLNAEFYDYYWKETDYLDCFEKAKLKILQVHHPLGSLNESYRWEDELAYPPFSVFIARR